MDDRVVQLRVGFMVLASLLIAGILVVLLGESPEFVKKAFQRTYAVRVWFPEARGLGEGSLVHRNGILVGRVASVRFAADEGRLIHRDGVPVRQVQFVGEKQAVALPEAIGTDEYETGVVVTAEIREGTKLYGQDVCRMESDLLGKPSLQFTYGEPGPAGPTLLDPQAKHLIRGQVAPDPLDSISRVTETLVDLQQPIQDASKSLADAGYALKDAAENVSAVLDADTQRQIQEAATLARQSLTDIQQMVGDEADRENFKNTLAELPVFLSELRATIDKAQARLDEVQAFTEKLGSPETIDRLDRATVHLDMVMDDLSAFSGALRNPQGSLGLLLEDRQLYDHLNRAAKNVEDVSRRLEPILNDVRIFTDKVARHPELVGVRGAIQQSSGIK